VGSPTFVPVEGWDDDPGLVHAAGGVVWRRRHRADEVLLVHRPRYDDWSLPKGKLDPGETPIDAARREVREETGFDVELGDELAATRYRDSKGRRKTVRYWEMQVVGGEFVANHETDEIRWMTVDDARATLTYAHDVAVVDELRARRG
jgi:8-oxo-dGTP diphosphatase